MNVLECAQQLKIKCSLCNKIILKRYLDESFKEIEIYICQCKKTYMSVGNPPLSKCSTYIYFSIDLRILNNIVDCAISIFNENNNVPLTTLYLNNLHEIKCDLNIINMDHKKIITFAQIKSMLS